MFQDVLLLAHKYDTMKSKYARCGDFVFL